VNVDAPHLGDGRGGSLRALGRVGGRDEPQRWLAGALAAHRDTLRRGGVAGGQAGLVDGELVRRVIAKRRVKGSAVGA
jgi:hypothetical protein